MNMVKNDVEDNSEDENEDNSEDDVEYESGRDGIENSIYWCFDEASEYNPRSC